MKTQQEALKEYFEGIKCDNQALIELAQQAFNYGWEACQRNMLEPPKESGVFYNVISGFCLRLGFWPSRKYRARYS